MKIEYIQIFMTKEYQKNVACKSLSLIMLEFVIRTRKKILPQTLLEECKYEIEKKKNGEPY